MPYQRENRFMNQPSKSVALHIGAHKTTTTHLQRSFLMQNEALIRAGVRYYGPDSLRTSGRGIADIFGLTGGETTSGRSPVEQRDFMLKDGHRLVLSEENFIGVLHDREGRINAPLYPRAQERVAALAEAVDAGPIDVLVGVRNPASFLVSAYGQALMGGHQISFDAYLRMNPLSQIYWPGLIARMRCIPNVGRITVWRFEEYRWRFHKICAAMMGSDVSIRIKPIPDAIHAGLSTLAIQHALAQTDTADFGSTVEQARALYPVSKVYPKFAPFSHAQLTQAESDYEQQMDAIARISDVTILRS